jgi:hypothetical protein
MDIVGRYMPSDLASDTGGRHRLSFFDGGHLGRMWA